MPAEKRVLSIQDYSVMGRCSLTVALPTFSALGFECVGLPTAVLSNHTRFKSWTYTDLTEELEPIVNKWNDYNHSFDAIGTGYLDDKQADIVVRIINKLKGKKTVVLVDPAMADFGKLYPAFKDSHIEAMKRLLKVADLTCPNITEACLLTNTPYKGESLNAEEINDLLDKLLTLGPSSAVLTGNVLPDHQVGCVFKTRDGRHGSYYTPDLELKCHGTGDLFAATLLGVYLKTGSLEESVKVAHDYVHEAIYLTKTNSNKDAEVYGVDFEEALPYLIKESNLD